MDAMQELSALIARNASKEDENLTAIPRLYLHRMSAPTGPAHAVYMPALCVVAQGRKCTTAGSRIHLYEAGKYLVTSVELSMLAQVLEATPDRPFLCLRLDLDPALIGALMLESDMERARREQPGPALAISDTDRDLLDACLRLLRLLDAPEHIPVLAPLIEKEILYRLLCGEQRAQLAQIAFSESKLQQVNRAISLIKRNYREALSVDSLASAAGMSRSALHQHFRMVTGLSPLQYQKQLRLQEARQLMLSQAVDAAMAGHLVGYESPSQFSREYRRLFGAPPQRDISSLRSA